MINLIPHNHITLTRKHILLIGIGLAILLCCMFFYCAKQWYGDWLLAHQTQKVVLNEIKRDQTQNQVLTLPDAHLFGQSLTHEVPITNLQFRVTGIVEKGDESLSKAYISISGQPGKIYQSGDQLPYGVKVYAITTNAVILENNNRLEKLPLPRAKLKFKAPVKESS